jgi:hypothetical protein
MNDGARCVRLDEPDRGRVRMSEANGAHMNQKISPQAKGKGSILMNEQDAGLADRRRGLTKHRFNPSHPWLNPPEPVKELVGCLRGKSQERLAVFK